MDFLRGLVLPVIILLMALALAFLGHVSTQDAHLLATRASAAATPDPEALAPRAEAEARKRMLLKRAREASTQGLGLYGAAGLLIALDALLVLGQLRIIRAATPAQLDALAAGATRAADPGRQG